GVILGAQGKMQRTGSGPRDERGGHAEHVALDFEAGTLERSGQPCAGANFLESELGMSMDLPGEIYQKVADSADVPLNSLLRPHADRCGAHVIGVGGHASSRRRSVGRWYSKNAHAPSRLM